jgi:hypothetical protein
MAGIRMTDRSNDFDSFLREWMAERIVALGRTWIDPERCERGLEALRRCRCEYDERLKAWKASPSHDWTSHGVDSARYFACGFEDSGSPVPTGSRTAPSSGGSSSWRVA